MKTSMELPHLTVLSSGAKSITSANRASRCQVLVFNQLGMDAFGKMCLILVTWKPCTHDILDILEKCARGLNSLKFLDGHPTSNVGNPENGYHVKSYKFI